MKCMKKRSFVNSARPRKTRFPELFLLAPLAIGCSFFPLQLATVRAEEAQQQSTSRVEQKIPPASELRELPPPEYAKLKSETLAKAKAQVSPKIRNPMVFFFFSSRRRHTRLTCDWSSDVCSSD